ncbi:phosphoribosylamine--glycine ligase [Oleispirillum naphthae]|uniref:phosphoribosylamine--glycine ligase n=1 Tax=Oleispirillum naphthae TaxID=2838853 RepID=UPI0030824107
MKILVVGSGGREHALCWAIRRSSACSALFCAPGNAGIAAVAACVPVDSLDVPGILAFCREEGIDFVVVGPEAPLVAGLVDRLEEAGIPAMGPSAAAARLEGSKGFMKDFCARHGIPTARYARFTDAAAAKAYVEEAGAPIVVKADGLAAGKGVVLCANVADAIAAIDMIMTDRAFGAAGGEVVIEEFLTGEEASFFALIDGITAVPLGAAQDHKAVGEGDTGPNTGGMGAYSPAPVVTPEIAETVMKTIVRPTVEGMAAEGHPFKGVLFAGLMIGPEGAKLLEFNVRFGDPECQVLMARLKSDIVPLLRAVPAGELDKVAVEWFDAAALVVVMAARGYPGTVVKDTEIRNLAAADAVPEAVVFHAGTRAEGGRVLAVGGRVLGVTARGRDVGEAQTRAYQAVDLIDWPEGFCRRDIGWRAVKA